MLDPALLRDQLDTVRAGLQNRGLDLGAELDELVSSKTGAGGCCPKSRA